MALLSCICINLLKPNGYFTYHHVTIKKLYTLPTLRYVLSMTLRANSDFCLIQH
jgi:hypothetical protein